MYQAADARYDGMTYNRCGSSGLRLPAVSLGFWHNFGSTGVYETMRKMCFTAFDNGVTHFDLANNYGPEPGSAEENLGRIVKENFMPYRDELIISTKAGYEMWNGPYGNWGSRKYLLASLDQSLTRLGLPYVDIFYHHRMDPETPLEETMGALDQAVKSGKALYAGLSNYNGQKMQEAAAILRDLKCPFVINQNRYSIFDRTIENNGLKEAAVKLYEEKEAEFPEAEQLRIIDGCCQAEHEALLRKCAPLYPDLEKTLKILSSRFPLFIVSNCQAGYIEVFLKSTGFGHYFKGHLCPGDTGMAKAENIMKIREDNNLSDPVYIGDTIGDFNACRKAGVPFIFAEYGFGQVDKPDYRITRPFDLTEICR